MPLAISSGPHDPQCSGCPACRADYAEMLSETPTQTARRLTANTAHMVRHAAAHGTFRVSQPRDEPMKTAGEWRDYFGHLLRGYGSVVTETHDPYHTATDATLHASCPFDDPNYEPHGAAPDGYAITLAKKESK